ncbi:hypothetical protein OG302_00695 [Streptomyces sp. NBC_01283]|uniref:hypothetical protein n=1 Tax=Streptomyces sp. NBC_01283 TaxID=2903812 RepID=UPI00352D3160|nr:hypothetical protein OG302_00695 [Streptomyces sp. NBC_01283]
MAGMLWALWLAFWPPQHEGRGYLGSGGFEDAPVSCGAPVLFQNSSFADWLYKERELGADDADEFATSCADKVDERVHGAVGIIVVTLPIAVLWVRSDLAFRARRAAMAWPSCDSKAARRVLTPS